MKETHTARLMQKLRECPWLLPYPLTDKTPLAKVAELREKSLRASAQFLVRHGVRVSR